MADKGFAPAQTTFPTLSFWGLGNFTPVLFRLSELHLSAIKGWNSFVVLREWGGGLSLAGSSYIDMSYWARLSGYFCLFCGFGFCWFLFGYGMGLWIAASGVLILTKLIVQQWREVDVTSNDFLPFSFCAAQNQKAALPSANLGNNNCTWLVCRHLFCFLKIGC